MIIVVLVKKKINSFVAKVVKKKTNIKLMILQRSDQRVPPLIYWKKLITFHKMPIFKLLS